MSNKQPWEVGVIPRFSSIKKFNSAGMTPRKFVIEWQKRVIPDDARQFGMAFEYALCGEPEGELHIFPEERIKWTATQGKKQKQRWGEFCNRYDYNCVFPHVLEEGRKAAHPILESDLVEFDSPLFQPTITGEMDGHKYSGHPDVKDLYGSLDRIWEVKTCGNAGKGFMKEARKAYYDTQLVAYMHATNSDVGMFLACENKPPYDWGIHVMYEGDPDYEAAKTIFTGWLKNFYRCKEENLWHQGNEFWQEEDGMFTTKFNRFGY